MVWAILVKCRNKINFGYWKYLESIKKSVKKKKKSWISTLFASHNALPFPGPDPVSDVKTAASIHS